jgi:hypothetical protein
MSTKAWPTPKARTPPKGNVLNATVGADVCEQVAGMSLIVPG